MKQIRGGNDADDSDEGADRNIHVCDGRHAGQSGSDDDEERNDVGPKLRRNSIGKDEMEYIAAALELVAGDSDVSEEDGEGAENASGLVVAGFEQIGKRKLGEFAGARGDEVDQQKAQPSA